MITELRIQNFKGIGSCNVNDLANVNLFIGKNDSGKSTILEAAYYLLKEVSSPPQLPTILSRRSDAFVGESELWFKYDTSFPVVVTAFFNDVRFDWRIALSQSAGEPVIVSSLSAGRVQVTLLGETRLGRGGHSLTMSSGGTMINNIKESTKFKDELTHYASNMSFVDCTLKSRTTEIEGILASFKRVPALEEEFGRILSDIYGKGSEWEFIPQLERTAEKRLAIREAGQLKYFSGFGDGLRCCVGILGTAMAVNDTAIFIEEIESHQHSGSLSKMIKHLVETARSNNLQIFLSTHSRAVYESFDRGVYLDDQKIEKREFRCFLVERDAESGKVTAECTDDIQKITKALE